MWKFDNRYVVNRGVFTCGKIANTTPFLRLVFDSHSTVEAIVTNPNNISDWNALFTASFTTLSGDLDTEFILSGYSGLIIEGSLFSLVGIIEINDYNCVVKCKQNSFESSFLSIIDLKTCAIIEATAFANTYPTLIDIRGCVTIGNDVFNGVSGNTLDLYCTATIAASNSVIDLIATNTVTVHII